MAKPFHDAKIYFSLIIRAQILIKCSTHGLLLCIRALLTLIIVKNLIKNAIPVQKSNVGAEFVTNNSNFPIADAIPCLFY